jgi:two-component sensor histidine kinase
VTPPRRRGFGSRLLERGLGRELQGTVLLEFRAQGVECVITFPLRPPATAPA